MSGATLITSVSQAMRTMEVLGGQSVFFGVRYHEESRKVGKVGKVLLQLLGESVSASTVSKVAKQLDAEGAALHRRKLKDRYRVLLFDGVVLARKTGAGPIRRPVLVVLGILPDGRKEVIDFRLAKGGIPKPGKSS